MRTLLIDALRSLSARRGHVFVAVGGLVLAMAACVLVGMTAIALSSPDPAIPDPDRVVVFGRRGGPEILDSELARLGHLASLAASIEAAIES